MIICGTGHRPQYLYEGYSIAGIEYLVSIAKIKLEEKRPDKIIQGGALGWDTALGIAAIRLNIPVISAIPFKGQESKWVQESIDIYNRLLDKSEKVVIVSEGGYSSEKFLVRDRWMVDNSDGVYALWNGINKGGTKYTMDYAQKIGRPIENCWDLYLKNLPKC